MEENFKNLYTEEWKNDLYTLWSLIRVHLSRLIIAVICSLVLSSINGAIAWLVKPAFDSLAVEKDQSLLFLLPIGVFFLFFLRGSFAFINNYLMNSIGAKIVKTLRQSFYEKILRLPMSFYSQKSSGSIVSKLLNDIKVLESHIPHTIKNLVVQSATVLILAGIALYRKWDLALLSFLVIPFVGIVAANFGKRMKKTSAATRKLISEVTEITHESLSAIKVIKSFTMKKEMYKKNDSAVTEHYRNVMREVRINEFTSASMEIIAGVGVAIILWYGGYLIVTEELSIGEFFSFIAAVLMIYTPLKRLSQVNNDFQKIRTALHRVKEVFLLPDEKTGTLQKSHIEGKILYKNVSFQYPESKDLVLKKINFEICPGETIAIVGYSGSGKSTLVDILLGFWDQYEGEILIDGTSIREYSLENMRSHIGVVSQDIVLFNDSVKNNILFGKPDATDENIIEAAKTAHAHDFIKDMPHLYDTRIGERGIKLSGGQKQRISLARAIIKNPKILILDEATSSLDSDSEKKIQEALEVILPGRTTIIIAHRLSTIKKADRILVMDKGQIIQQGNHNDLSAKEGVYQELYNLSTIEA